MTVLITLTLAGSDTGPFDLYSNADGFTTPFQTGVAKSVLEAGLSSGAVPDGSTIILVKSTGTCDRDLYLNISGAPTTTTTSSTTSSSTTLAPAVYELAQIGQNAKKDGCPIIGSVLRIFLDASDYALFVDNGNSFAGLGGGASTTCTAIARNQVGTPITAILFDEENISWKLTAGNFTYYDFQC